VATVTDNSIGITEVATTEVAPTPTRTFQSDLLGIVGLIALYAVIGLAGFWFCMHVVHMPTSLFHLFFAIYMAVSVYKEETYMLYNQAAKRWLLIITVFAPLTFLAWMVPVVMAAFAEHNMAPQICGASEFWIVTISMMVGLAQWVFDSFKRAYSS
jgi:small-conductance mechanosensitive channel